MTDEAVNQGVNAVETAIDNQFKAAEQAIDSTMQNVSKTVDDKLTEANKYADNKRVELVGVLNENIQKVQETVAGEATNMLSKLNIGK